ncbi:MAG: hypothetical protein LBI43_00505 [Streptococcaceae bacterium]|jgi:MFS family permease|nr:hypothetical protein [Streptococcaceae bacterium]
MSVNKILALIGAIITSLLAGIYMLISLAGAFAVAGSSAVGPAFFFILALILAGVIVFSWIGFTKLDKPNDKPWKILFLVFGILGCLTLAGIIPGVLYILTFALNIKQQSTAEKETAAATETTGWTAVSATTVVSAVSEHVTSESTVGESDFSESAVSESAVSENNATSESNSL